MNINVTNKATFEVASKSLTKEGFLVNFNVPIARDGIIEYSGRELNRPQMPKVRAYRPKSTFTPKVLESAKMLPVTIDHPQENVVSPDNAKRTVIGATGSEVYLSGGELIEKMIAIYDKEAIRDIEEFGKKEVSIGLLATHDFTPGKTPEGEEYDAIESIISLNHLSVVNAGKAGPKYRLNSKQEENSMRELVKKTVNGLELEMTEASASLLNAKEEESAKSVLNTVLAALTETAEEHTKMLNSLLKNAESEDKTDDKEDKTDDKEDKTDGKEDKTDDKEDKADDKENACSNAVVEDAHEETLGNIYTDSLKAEKSIFTPGNFR